MPKKAAALSGIIAYMHFFLASVTAWVKIVRLITPDLFIFSCSEPRGTDIYLFSMKITLYCAFDVFQKVVFCLALYTEEVNLQIFVLI